MNDEAFFDLQLRMMIVPKQASWPAPELLHWQKLHAVANEARERVSRAYMQMDEIDRNSELSRDGKYRQRRKIAAQALAELEASRTLVRARDAVRYVTEWQRDEEHVTPEVAEGKALKEAEAGWQRAIDLIDERAGLDKGPDIRRCYSRYRAF
jgi:hypothetical protein